MTRRKWIVLITVAGLGVLLSPMVIYLVGRPIAGEYEDPRGLLGLYANIYEDALALNPGALLVLFAPALFIGIWMGIGQLKRSTRMNQDPGVKPAD
jgi:hypothetical protein